MLMLKGHIHAARLVTGAGQASTCLEVGGDDLGTVGLQDMEQLVVLDACHLQDLSCAVAEVPSVQGLQEGLHTGEQ